MLAKIINRAKRINAKTRKCLEVKVLFSSKNSLRKMDEGAIPINVNIEKRNAVPHNGVVFRIPFISLIFLVLYFFMTAPAEKNASIFENEWFNV